MNAITDLSLSQRTPRHDGWTPQLRGRFLALLAESGNVRLCARRCGRSAQSAYVQRRRDPDFAQGWAAALLLARDHAEQVLADRAIEGVEEPIFYRGEQVGARRRYDTRLLLAHLARLDRLEADEEAQRAAGRFDELVALVAGAAPPEALAAAEGQPLPRERQFCAEAAAGVAERAADETLPEAWGEEAQAERDQAVFAAGDAAYAAAEAEWNAWFDGACALVDDLGEGTDEKPDELGPAIEFKSLEGLARRPASTSWTVSIVSTSSEMRGAA